MKSALQKVAQAKPKSVDEAEEDDYIYGKCKYANGMPFDLSSHTFLIGSSLGSR